MDTSSTQTQAASVPEVPEVQEVPEAPSTSSQASTSVPEVPEASSTPSQASAPVPEVPKASSTPRSRITHDDRIKITTLRSIGWTYQAIAAYVGCSQRQVQYTVQEPKQTPKNTLVGLSSSVHHLIHITLDSCPVGDSKGKAQRATPGPKKG